MIHIKGKVALITGGSSGIGAGTAKVLASEGYDIAITYSKNLEGALSTAKYIRESYNVKCLVIQADMEKRESAQYIVNKTTDHFSRLDLLVNNAGSGIYKNIKDFNDDEIEYLINLNFRGYYLTSKAAAKYMIENNIKGSIICISSSRAERAYSGDSVYGGMKAALNRSIQSIALDLAPYGIRVNCISPGAIRVRNDEKTIDFYKELGARIPLGREGLPQDIGNAVAFMASDKASYITGISLRIDGGLILPGMPETRRDPFFVNWYEEP